jgi:hypothetical protein
MNITVLEKNTDDLQQILDMVNDLPDKGEEFPETYEGEFVVTPAVDSEQTLLTAGKYIEENITVEKIPITSVSNSSGGNTVIIG